MIVCARLLRCKVQTKTSIRASPPFALLTGPIPGPFPSDRRAPRPIGPCSRSLSIPWRGVDIGRSRFLRLDRASARAHSLTLVPMPSRFVPGIHRLRAQAASARDGQNCSGTRHPAGRNPEGRKRSRYPAVEAVGTGCRLGFFESFLIAFSYPIGNFCVARLL